MSTERIDYVPGASGTAMPARVQSSTSGDVPEMTQAPAASFSILGPWTINSSTPQQIKAATPAGTVPGVVTIRNQGTTDMQIGPSGVTWGNGFLIKAGEAFDFKTLAAIYGITQSGTTIAVGYEEDI